MIAPSVPPSGIDIKAVNLSRRSRERVERENDSMTGDGLPSPQNSGPASLLFRLNYYTCAPWAEGYPGPRGRAPITLISLSRRARRPRVLGDMPRSGRKPTAPWSVPRVGPIFLEGRSVTASRLRKARRGYAENTSNTLNTPNPPLAKKARAPAKRIHVSIASYLHWPRVSFESKGDRAIARRSRGAEL